jgi:hypothetical protein
MVGNVGISQQELKNIYELALNDPRRSPHLSFKLKDYPSDWAKLQLMGGFTELAVAAQRLYYLLEH